MIYDFLNIIIPVMSGLAGLYAGYRLTEHSRNKRDKVELEKIHKLISLDFSRIFNLCKNMQKNHRNIINDLDNFSKSFKINPPYAMMNLKADLSFYYRKTLENSGSLIKLEPDEIPKIQFAYDQISGTSENSKNAWVRLSQYITNEFENIEPDQLERDIKNQVKLYFETVFGSYKIIDDAFKHLDISWLDLDLFLKEYPSEKEKT